MAGDISDQIRGNTSNTIFIWGINLTMNPFNPLWHFYLKNHTNLFSKCRQEISVGIKKKTHSIKIELNKQNHKMFMEISIRYRTIETKEATGIGYNGFFFHTSTQVKAQVRSINIQYGQLLVWTSLYNIPITTMVKFLSSYIERTRKTSACLTDIRDICWGHYCTKQ